MPDHLFLTDADNTLWDTDAVYRNAQLALLGDVEGLAGFQAKTDDRLAYLREMDQLLAQGHHSGLRYPPALLVLALKFRLEGIRTDQAVRGALLGDVSPDGESQRIVQAFFDNLSRRAPLRPGVSMGLDRLAQAGHRVIVATEGTKEKIEAILDAHGLRSRVQSVLSAPKAAPLYHRLARMADGAKMMVGDQLDRDIEPAKAAGFVTAWFPGGFTPRWSLHQSDAADLEITSFDQAVDAFMRLANGGRSKPRLANKSTALAPRQAAAKRRLQSGGAL